MVLFDLEIHVTDPIVLRDRYGAGHDRYSRTRNNCPFVSFLYYHCIFTRNDLPFPPYPGGPGVITRCISFDCTSQILKGEITSQMYEKGIEAFLAISSCQSIVEAAYLLHLTPSAVSRRLQNLEEELDMILIDRQKGVRQSKLTLSGEKFFPIAEKWSQLWRETHGIKSEDDSLYLKIGCVDSVNTFIMPPIYKELQNYKQPVSLRIQVNPSPVMYEKMERRDLDVSFVVQEQRHQQLEVTPFLAEKMYIIRLRHHASVSPVVKASELDPKYEFYIRWSPSHQLWHDRIWNPLVKSTIEIDTVPLILKLLDDPRHWAIVPRSVLDLFKDNSELIIQDLEPSIPKRVTYIVTHRYPRISAKKGIDILKELAKKRGYLNVNETSYDLLPRKSHPKKP